MKGVSIRMAKAKTLEESFEELEQTIAKLEEGERTLDESFKLYQEGMKLLKYCNSKIDKVEKKLIELRAEENKDGIWEGIEE